MGNGVASAIPSFKPPTLGDEQDLRRLLGEKDLAIREMRHRVANNLQLLAGIFSARACLAQSEEARSELRDAARRVLSVAAIQQHFDRLNAHQPVDVARYLLDLCGTLGQSMVGQDRPVSLVVDSDTRAMQSADALNVGLIVTELVINALKHAFPADKTGASIQVSYRRSEPDWTLTVSDNGVGKSAIRPTVTAPRLGARLIDLLAKQLNANVATTTGSAGTTVSVTHAMPLAPRDPSIGVG